MFVGFKVKLGLAHNCLACLFIRISPMLALLQCPHIVLHSQMQFHKGSLVRLITT